MANIWQITYLWSGFAGAPGYTNLFFKAPIGDPAEALAAVTKARILFAGLVLNLPDTVHINNDTVAVLRDEDSGLQIDVVTVTGLSAVVGGSGAPYSGSSGMCVDWLTSTVNRGRRIQGRSFMVPLAGDQYETDGTPGPDAITRLATAAEDMRTATGPEFGVWSRPRLGVGGLLGTATSSRVPDTAVVLRSRRA